MKKESKTLKILWENIKVGETKERLLFQPKTTLYRNKFAQQHQTNNRSFTNV